MIYQNYQYYFFDITNKQMRTTSSKPPKQKTPTIPSRFQLVSKSIAQNVDSAKNHKNKSLYCQHCNRLSDSVITFKPTDKTYDKLTKIIAVNLRVDPYSTHFPGILQTQNLRLIQLNRKYQLEKDQLIQTIGKLVSQCKVYIENYDSNRAIVGLENILRTVGGNKIASYITQDKIESQWQNIEAQKIKIEYLQKSMQAIKSIVQRNIQYFPLTKQTLTQKFYLSLEDLQSDICNFKGKVDSNNDLMDLFQIRLNEFAQDLQKGSQMRRVGLFENQFQRLRQMYLSMEQQKEQLFQKTKQLKLEILNQRQVVQNPKPIQLSDNYYFLLNQCLTIQQFLNNQQEQ